MVEERKIKPTIKFLFEGQKYEGDISKLSPYKFALGNLKRTNLILLAITSRQTNKLAK